MAFLADAQSRKWTIIVLIGALAVGAWGTYAWKISDKPDATPIADASSTTDGGSGESRAASGRTLTTLTARKPATEPQDVDLSSTVRTNAPVSIDDEVTMALNVAEAPPPVEEATQTQVPQPDPLSGPEAPEETQAPEVEINQYLMNGRDALSRGEMVVARSAFSRALQEGLPADDEAWVRDQLRKMTRSLLFSRANNPSDPLTDTHIIGGGESLHVISKRYKIPVPLLMSINKIDNPNRIRAGDRLKVIKGPFNAVISKSAHRMDIYVGDAFVRSYAVGLGTNGGTPLGHWVVADKLENPDWTDPRTNQYYASDDPDNPIGERWIKLKCVAGDCVGRTGFGIHGTIDPDSIGADMSMGCVRLAKEDVVEVYDMFARHHSRIEVTP